MAKPVAATVPARRVEAITRVFIRVCMTSSDCCVLTTDHSVDTYLSVGRHVFKSQNREAKGITTS
jgi:hypothetical protein